MKYSDNGIHLMFILLIKKKASGSFALHIQHCWESAKLYMEKIIKFSIIMNSIFEVIFIST